MIHPDLPFAVCGLDPNAARGWLPLDFHSAKTTMAEANLDHLVPQTDAAMTEFGASRLINF
jgi:hypothetical protein